MIHIFYKPRQWSSIYNTSVLFLANAGICGNILRKTNIYEANYDGYIILYRTLHNIDIYIKLFQFSAGEVWNILPIRIG